MFSKRYSIHYYSIIPVLSVSATQTMDTTITVAGIKTRPETLGLEYARTYQLDDGSYLHIVARSRIPIYATTRNREAPVRELLYSMTEKDYPIGFPARVLRILDNIRYWIYYVARQDPSNPRVVEYAMDATALFVSALRQRGVYIRKPHTTLDYLHLLKNIEKLGWTIEKADRPAPSLGNKGYVDIASTTYDMLQGLSRIVYG